MFRISTLRADVTKTYQKVVSSSRSLEGLAKPHIIAGVAIVCAILPFDLFQLVFMLIGAICYTFIRMPLPPPKKVSAVSSHKSGPTHVRNGTAAAHWRGAAGRFAAATGASSAARPPRGKIDDPGNRMRQPRPIQSQPQPVILKTAGKTPTAMPIAPVIFKADGFDGEVNELLERLAPKPESDDLVQTVASTINSSIRHLFPGVEVIGVASTDFRSSSAFGVAAPDVEVVVKVKNETLAKRCWPRSGGEYISDLKKLQKSAVRTITERLVSDCGFKFRRSAFRGTEPRVTLLAPGKEPKDGTFPIEISINSATPLHNVALMNKCKGLDPRLEGLFMLVRRWSKDRAICHAPKGHLPRFQWNLLVAYFMQVALPDGEQHLPPLLDLGSSATNSRAAAAAAEKGGDPTTSVAQLFIAFLCFYTEEFQWGREVISVRSGKRTFREEPVACCVSIEDPFDASASLDLGDCLTHESFKRMQDELKRAKALCDQNASLSEVLELWAPDDESNAVGEGQAED